MNTRRKFLTMLGLGAAAVPPAIMAAKPEPLPAVKPIEGEVRPFLGERIVPHYFGGGHTHNLTTAAPMQSFGTRPVIHKVFHDGKWVEV